MIENWNKNETVDESKLHFNIGYSALSRVIYAGRTKKDSKGHIVWTSKQNCTKHAIDPVFELMRDEAKEREGGKSDLFIKGHGTLSFELDKEQKEDGL